MEDRFYFQGTLDAAETGAAADPHEVGDAQDVMCEPGFGRFPPPDIPPYTPLTRAIIWLAAFAISLAAWVVLLTFLSGARS